MCLILQIAILQNMETLQELSLWPIIVADAKRKTHVIEEPNENNISRFYINSIISYFNS